MKFVILFLTLNIFSVVLVAQKHIEVSDSAITYSGRFDFSNPNHVRYDWSGASIYFNFSGKQLSFTLEGGERNYFNVFIDEQLHEVMHAPNDTVYAIKGIKGKGWHSCRLQKRTEGGMGTTLFKGIIIGKNDEVKAYDQMPKRKIEFIGNSLTCGYGTEGASRDEDFLPKTENVNKSYAFISARAFNAECYVTAHSGLGVVRNYNDQKKVSTALATLPNRYHQTLDEDSTLNWDFTAWQPDVVVINLGSNDYSTNVVPDAAMFKHRYVNFIREIRQYYGSVPIFCLCGPTRNEPAYSNIKEVVESSGIIYDDKNLYFIGLPRGLLNTSSDLGSDWHPSYRGQRKMANHIIPTIANVLKWNYDDAELRFADEF